MKNVAIFGDSVLRGVIFDKNKQRYIFANGIDWKGIEQRLSVNIDNHSRMGATISYGYEKLQAYLEQKPQCDSIIIEYGGNDCDFEWKDVAENRSKNHISKTTPEDFKKILINMVTMVREYGAKPILMTLPTIDAKKYYKWISKQGLNTDNILYFLGDVEHIYRYHELFNMIIMEVANNYQVELIDIRKVFLTNGGAIKKMLCIDGIHPNLYAEKLIVETIVSQYEINSKENYENKQTLKQLSLNL